MRACKLWHDKNHPFTWRQPLSLTLFPPHVGPEQGAHHKSSHLFYPFPNSCQMDTIAVYRLRSWVSDGLCNFLQITGWLMQVAARNSSELSKQVSQNQWSQVYECLLTRASLKSPGSPLGTNFQLTRPLTWRQICDKQEELWGDRCEGGGVECREKVQKTCPENTVFRQRTPKHQYSRPFRIRKQPQSLQPSF